MSDISVWFAGTAAAVSILVLIILIIALRKITTPTSGDDIEGISRSLDIVGSGQDRIEKALRADLDQNREQTSKQGRELREEVGGRFQALSDSILKQMTDMARLQEERLEAFARQLRNNAAEAEKRLQVMQEIIERSVMVFGEQIIQRLATNAKSLKDDIAGFGGNIQTHMTQLFEIQKSQHTDFSKKMNILTETNQQAAESLRQLVAQRLDTLRIENTAKLDQMRQTVDEKLQGTLEKRLGESFRLVSERLEAVQKGLGEMQTLASGVGDLKRVLTNVRARGTWGEVQLGTLLEQILTSEQYLKNVQTREHSAERVDFAIRLPGHDGETEVLLPIDAKFPLEDYERLQRAAEQGDFETVESTSKALGMRVIGCARDIASKYIDPPATTDFAIMFLPTEGLYAEVLKRPGLADELQRDHRVVVAGPTTLAALLNSLQMGFRTLAIEKRSSEVWLVLGAVKAEFGKFGPVIQKVRRKLTEASDTIDNEIGVRERAIYRKLREVEALPAAEAATLIGAVGQIEGLVEEEVSEPA
jgi:DNA recombination protein RmuC